MIKKATFAAGCFWAVEYAFAQLAGVNNTLVGYLGACPRIKTYCEKAGFGQFFTCFSLNRATILLKACKNLPQTSYFSLRFLFSDKLLGGNLQNPDYKQVCRGDTGHAEVVQLEYDDTVITYEILLQKFWSIHDPTQVNRQGADIGTQYRSSIFYHDAQQRCTAENSKKLLNDSGQFNNEIATEIVAASQFYQAEDYHQDYLNKNNLPVCSI